LKEQDAAVGGGAEPSAPPYENKFSHKIKIQHKDDSDFDSVSDEEDPEDTLAHQVLGTMHFGFPPWAKRLPGLAKSPLPAAAIKEKIQLVLQFTLCFRDQTLTTLA
jgi:hypothetical protein